VPIISGGVFPDPWVDPTIGRKVVVGATAEAQQKNAAGRSGVVVWYATSTPDGAASPPLPALTYFAVCLLNADGTKDRVVTLSELAFTFAPGVT